MEVEQRLTLFDYHDSLSGVLPTPHGHHRDGIRDLSSRATSPVQGCGLTTRNAHPSGPRRPVEPGAWRHARRVREGLSGVIPHRVRSNPRLLLHGCCRRSPGDEGKPAERRASVGRWAVRHEWVRTGSMPVQIPPRGLRAALRGYSGESRHAPATLASVGSTRAVTHVSGEMTLLGDSGKAGTVNSSTMRGPKGLAGKT